MDSDTEVSDDHIIQIIPTPDHTPNQSHDQTPIATSTNSPTPKHEIRGVNQMTPEELSSLKVDLTIHICREVWLKSKQIIEKCPDMVRMPLNYSGYTALHLAVSNRRFEIVNELVKCMRPEDMLIPNSDGNTALHVAASEGSIEIVKELVNRMRPEDMLIPNSDGMLPVHLAALSRSNDRRVDILSSEEVLDKMDFKDIERLFMMTIRFDMFDSARRLFEKHPTALAIARNEEDVTGVKMLGEKPRGMSDVCDRLFGEVLTEVETLEQNREYEIKSGDVEAVEMLLDNNPRLVTYRDHRNGWNLLHLVVLFRQQIIFDIIPPELTELLGRAVDYGGNNILHLAGRLSEDEFEELSASIQMQRDLEWFKVVERNIVPDKQRTMRNNAGMRPINVFYAEHKKLSQEIKDTAKGIAKSGMLVSTLVATVAFAAALTVPGDKTNAWFTVFILTNAFLLCTSSASLLTFFRYLTSSRLAQSHFVKSLHPSLTFGRWLLIISVAAIPVAFTATSFLIFDHTASKWVSYAVASIGLFSMLYYLLFSFYFLEKHLWARFYCLGKED